MIPLSSVKLVIDIMNNVAGRVLKNKSEEFEYYVTNVFYEAKNINNNYMDILLHLKVNYKEGKLTYDQLVDYLQTRRTEYYEARQLIRSQLNIIDYYKRNEDLTNFKYGVLGILQGGLPKYGQNNISEFTHNHTIIDTINTIKYEHIFIEPMRSKHVIDRIEKQEEYLREAWILVSNSYVKCKQTAKSYTNNDRS